MVHSYSIHARTHLHYFKPKFCQSACLLFFVYCKQSKTRRWEGLSIINTVGRNAGEDCAKVKLLQVRFTEVQVRNVGVMVQD